MGSGRPYPWLAGRRPLQVAPETGADGAGWIGAYSWVAVQSLLTSPGVSSHPYFERLQLADRFGPTMIGVDGPIHRRLRGAVQSAFTREAVEELRLPVVRPAIDSSIAQFEGSARAELVSTICSDVPVRVIAGLLGVDAAVVEELRPLAEVVTVQDLGDAEQVADRCRARFVPHLDAARDRAGVGTDGLLSMLLADPTTAVSDAEAFALVRILVIAGIDTLGRSAATLLMALLTHPMHLDAARASVPAMAAAVDESIRWECPAVSVPRLATEDLEIAGTTVPEGSLLHCYLAGANRDPARWDHPDVFDPARARRTHAGFGLGPHSCLGKHLARLTLVELGLGLLDGLPGLRLDPDAAPPRVTGEHVRSPEVLHVIWDPRRHRERGPAAARG